MLDLNTLKRTVQEATAETETARQNSELYRRYYDGDQRTPAERAALAKKKQPDIVINRIKRKIDGMVGLEQKTRTDPIALPTKPASDEAADIATKALRYVEASQKIDVKASSAFENMVIEGYGGVEVVAEEVKGQMEVIVRRIRWEDTFYDPHSREKDFSDANYMGIMKWMSEDAAMAFCLPFWAGTPEELAAILDSKTDLNVPESYGDRPTAGIWIDKKNRRVRVCQCYYLYKGVWHLSIFTGREVLYNEVSPYLDEHGKPRCAMILMTAYIDQENKRYGVIKDMIGAQDEINRRRSLGVHFINSRQTWSPAGAVNARDVKFQLSQPDGHVEVNVDQIAEGIMPFNIIPTQDMAQGNLAMMQDAKGEIDNFGPNPSLLGEVGKSQSGRAIQAQQQAGTAELAPIYDSKADWIERVYRAVWAGIRQFWTGPKWIRITDDINGVQFVGLNQPVMDPNTGMVTMMNPVAEIDVDIIVEASQEWATMRHEQFAKLAEMAERGFPIPPDVIIEASDLRDKRKLLESIQAANTPPPEMVQMQQQMAALDAELKAQKAFRDNAAGQKDLASIGKLQAEAANEAAEAQTNGITAAARTAVAQRIGL